MFPRPFIEIKHLLHNQATFYIKTPSHHPNTAIHNKIYSAFSSDGLPMPPPFMDQNLHFSKIPLAYLICRGGYAGVLGLISHNTCALYYALPRCACRGFLAEEIFLFPKYQLSTFTHSEWPRRKRWKLELTPLAKPFGILTV